MTIARRAVPAVAFLACILAANYVTTRYGLVPVGFGLMATAGTYFAGATFVLRDSIQGDDRAGGRLWVLAVIAVGAVLSFVIADHDLAFASAVAFIVSESLDFAVYTPLRRRGYVRAAVASNIVGAVVDTALFLWLATPFFSKVIPGYNPWAQVPGQLVGKLTITAVVIAAVALVRARKAVTA